MQKILKLYKSDAEHLSEKRFTQDMIYGYSLLNDIVLKVKLSITIEIDKQGAIDFKKNWSVGGITNHVEVHQYFIR